MQIMFVARYLGLVFVGLLLWMLGLVVLDVPPNLPLWRHSFGGLLFGCALHLWRKL
jgi:uncharacterized membrane protein